MLFVNLPLSYIHKTPRYLDLFLACRIQPELGLDAWACDRLDRTWHENLGHRLQAKGLKCTIHLPFFDLQPGSMDPLVLNATRQRLHTALDLASVYQPVCLVAHAGFRAPLYTEHTNEWIRASVQTWKDCLHHAPASGRIVLENVHETDPDILAAVFKRFPENTLGWCLDMGHWNCFARGRDRENLEHWMTILGPRLTHIHLHDNHGLKDEHLGMGQGSISWEDFFSLANTTRGRVTVTLEPHEPNALVQSLAFLSLQKIPSGPLHDLPSAAYDLLQRTQSRIHDLKL